MKKIKMRTAFLFTSTVSLAFLLTTTSRLAGQALKPVAKAYYSTRQAAIGKDLFNRNCASCHSLDPSAPPIDMTGRKYDDFGYALFSGTLSLAGTEFLQHWYSVGDLYSKINMTMPTTNVHGLSSETYVNILAYLLEVIKFPASARDLVADGDAMKAMTLQSIPLPVENRIKPASQSGYYTDLQARRGENYFVGACNSCHGSSSKGPRAIIAPGFHKWRNVAEYYNMIRTSMPNYDAAGLSSREFVDITAYLLKANGMPSGMLELPDDVNAMRNMTLEPRFHRIFNGINFEGLGFVIGSGCTPRPAGCGQTDPGTTFSTRNGTIFSSGKPSGYFYTQEQYLDFTLRFDYRFEPYKGMESDDDFFGNSGYMIFINEHHVWPKMIEIQGMNRDVLGVIPYHSQAAFTVDNEARKKALKPVGQWNSIEIVSKNNQVHSYLNGVLVSTISQHEFTRPGFIGFQSEGGEISWRNIRIKDERASEVSQ